MNEEFVSIPLPTDSNGFISFQCGLCSFRFKLSAAEINEAPESQWHCPYCGIPSSPSNYYTPEVAEAAMRQVGNILKNQINSFTKKLEASFRQSKYLRFERGKPLRPTPDKPLFEDESLEVVKLTCCNRHVKTLQPKKAALIYCPYCGVIQ